MVVVVEESLVVESVDDEPLVGSVITSTFSLTGTNCDTMDPDGTVVAVLLGGVVVVGTPTTGEVGDDFAPVTVTGDVPVAEGVVGECLLGTVAGKVFAARMSTAPGVTDA